MSHVCISLSMASIWLLVLEHLPSYVSTFDPQNLSRKIFWIINHHDLFGQDQLAILMQLLFMICNALLIYAITYISLLPKSCKFWELTVQLPHPLPSHISVYITSCCAANDLLPTFTCVNVNSTSHTSICANMLETKMGYLVQSCSIVCLQFQAENVQHTWRRQKEAQHWQLKSSY